MPDKSESPSADQGCLALFVGVALAALLLTVSVFTPPGTSFALYVAVFAITALVAAVLGMPLYVLALRVGRANVWTASLAGMMTGMAMPLIGAISNSSGQPWRYVAIYAAIGAAGGIAFYLTATAARTPRRNAALLCLLTTAATLAALLSAPAP